MVPSEKQDYQHHFDNNQKSQVPVLFISGRRGWISMKRYDKIGCYNSNNNYNNLLHPIHSIIYIVYMYFIVLFIIFKIGAGVRKLFL